MNNKKKDELIQYTIAMYNILTAKNDYYIEQIIIKYNYYKTLSKIGKITKASTSILCLN